MKGLKEFFRMIITAVVCFGTKLFGVNKKGVVRVCTENGNAFFLTGRHGIWNYSESEEKDLISKNGNLELKSRNTPKIKEMGVLYPLQQVSAASEGSDAMETGTGRQKQRIA